ncbi:MAG TPA: VOC family protein [Gemmatimonadales bacterium]
MSVDIGFTHVALPVTDLDACVRFYAKYANLVVVHRRCRSDSDAPHEVAWLSDRTRAFALVLVEVDTVDRPLGPFAHLGVACPSRAELDRRCADAEREGCLRHPLSGGDGPAGYRAMLADPDGHTLELSYGQEVAAAVAGVE